MNLLNTIKEDNNLTQSQMAEKLNISVRQVSRRLRELKEKGVIERIGSDRKGYWKILKAR